MSFAVPVVLLALWEIASRLAVVSPRYFPAPTTIAWVLVDRFVEGDLGAQSLVTLARLACAFALAAVPGVLLGLLMGIARPVRAAIEPYIAFIFPVPKITLLPFLLIILGVGEPAFVLTGATSAFFQIVISTLGGVQTLDPRLLEAGRNYGAHGARLFWKVILPAALPSIFTGLRLGLGLALVSLVAVEFIAAKSGLGHLVYRHWQMLSTPEMYAAFVLVGALGLALTRGLRALQARILTWQDDPGRL
ncbi:MAG TPA: ABC transporter permease [Methylomirabilota bacterium]|jgi:ABC-type nitrate/sulfonate/bicarbonate transport system permease component|nr:ABC transporter permease [Methylomirabilota bacterium]